MSTFAKSPLCSSKIPSRPNVVLDVRVPLGCLAKALRHLVWTGFGKQRRVGDSTRWLMSFPNRRFGWRDVVGRPAVFADLAAELAIDCFWHVSPLLPAALGSHSVRFRPTGGDAA